MIKARMMVEEIVMSTSDYILLWVVVLLLFISAVLKIKLAEKKGAPYSTPWKIQIFVFPVMLLLVLILLWTGIKNWVLPGIFLGIIEEFVCHFIRKKKKP